MEYEPLRPGLVTMTRSFAGNGNRLLAGGPGPGMRVRSGRDLDGPSEQTDELTIAGVAWRRTGASHGLVVMARGRNSGGMLSSLATLTVFYGDRDVKVTAPVTVVAGGATGMGGSRQTLRFVFRLPPSASEWAIDGLVLHFLGRDVTLAPPPPPPRATTRGVSLLFPLPAQPADPAPAQPVDPEPPQHLDSVPAQPAADEAPAPPADHALACSDSWPARASEQTPESYGPAIVEAVENLVSLHDEIAQVCGQLADVGERERNRRWLMSVAEQLEYVARELSECRQEFDRISALLVSPAIAVPEPGPPPPQAEAQPPVPRVPTAPPRRRVPTPSPPRRIPTTASPPRVPAPSPPGARWNMDQALAEFRTNLLEQALPEPEVTPPRSKPALPPIRTVREPAWSAARRQSVRAERAPASAPMTPAGAPASKGMLSPVSLPGRIERAPDEGSWFSIALRRLAGQDREAAGRALLAVLPAQAIATPRYLRYDLIVSEYAVLAVDARPLDTRVRRLTQPRPLSETDAWITGSFEQLGQLVLDRRRRLLPRLRRQTVRVKGERRRLGDLLSLVNAPLRILDLCAVGARLAPDLLLRMIIEAAQPEYDGADTLSIRFEPVEQGLAACTVVFNNATASVLGASGSALAPTAVARGSSRELMHLLAELPLPAHEKPVLIGSPEPLQLLQDCVKRLEFAVG